MLALPDVNIRIIKECSIPEQKTCFGRRVAQFLLHMLLKHPPPQTLVENPHILKSLISFNASIRMFFSALFLICGLFFYLICRNHTFVNVYLGHINYFDEYAYLCNTLIVGSLPSFIHTVAFSLLTSAIIEGTRTNDFLVCISWFLAECIFEALPLFKQYIPLSILLTNDNIVTYGLNTYLTYGTYDHHDICAIALGAIVSGYIMIRTQKEK